MSDPKRYYLYAGLECHAFSKVEAVLKFSEEDDGMWVKYEDYANLKAEVERLKAVSTIEQRTIQGLQNTPEWSEIARLTADYRELESKFRQASDERADYAKDIAILKAEVFQLTSERDGLFECNEGNLKECSRLKAEVNSLRKESEMMDRERMSDEYDLNNQVRIINGLLTEKENLKSENERLRKAGDAMADAMERNGCDPLGCHEENKDAVKAWLAAKEGKPSV